MITVLVGKLSLNYYFFEESTTCHPFTNMDPSKR
jgi:hypothetical protein